MAGRFERRFPALLCILAAIACIATNASGEAVHGRSRDLNIDFEVAGDNHWCRPRIDIRLTAPTERAFASDTVPFLQMIGRIRAVVLSQCPEIENIRFEGEASGRTVYSAETSRLTRWRRIIELDPTTHKPMCPSERAERCPAQVEAYLSAQRLFRGDSFADTELTSVLEPDSGDLTLRAGDVVGKLRIAAREQIAKEFATAPQFASAIISDIDEGCRQSGGRPEAEKPRDFDPALAERATICREPNKPAAYNIILVWATNDNFHVFSLWTEGRGNRGFGVADRLARAIMRSR